MVDTLSDAKRALLELRLARRRLVPVAREGRLPLSAQQEGLWFLDRLNPGLSVYTIPFTWRLLGPLDVHALQGAFAQLVARHEALRTRFPEHDGRPYQVIDPPAVFEFGEVDKPFDLEAGPLFRAQLTRVGAEEHVLAVNVHHITADGWSIAILTRELADLYQGRALAPLMLQPVDVAVWQRRQNLDTQLGYWREQLHNLPTLDFPTDRQRPATRTGAGGTVEALFPMALFSTEVEEVARAARATQFEVLLAAFFTLLARYTGQSDLVIGSVFNGRTSAELESLVGHFADPLVLRVDADGDPAFREMIGRAGACLRGAVANHVPFSVVVDELKPVRDPSRNPLFQVSFSHVPAGSGVLPSFPGLTVETLPFQGTQSRFDLSATVVEAVDGQLGMLLEYSAELFDVVRMRGLVEHLGRVLRQGVDDPDIRVSELKLLSPEQEHQLLHELQPQESVPSDVLLGDLVVAGDRPALVYGEQSLTYRQLSDKANQLAHHLQREWQVGPDDVVGVLLERGPDLIVAQLGVARSGAAWVPLDPAHPRQRLAYLIEETNARVVITDAPQLVPGNTISVEHPGLPTGRPQVRTLPDDLAYVMFTSGSTGRPKGVLVSHRAAVDFVVNARDLYRITEEDVVLQFANPCFDVSVFDVFTTLAANATLLTAPRTQLHDPAALLDLLSQVTVAHLPPAVLSTLDADADLARLRLLIVGGEAYPASLAQRWVRPWREFHNSYGPTETTVDCTDHRFRSGDESVPLGRAMVGHRAFVLDDNLHPVPIGIAGHLYISGPGLARGYLNQPHLTATRFLPNPYQPGQRMYHTGDQARWTQHPTHGHTIEYLGRTDRQLKLNGIRIEPAEIDTALLAHPHITQAHTTTHDKQLIAYITTNTPITPTQLRQHLLTHLPTHLIPTTITTLQHLPTNPNGKIDPTQLPPPTTHTTTAPPTTPTQTTLAHHWHQLLNPPHPINTGDNFFTLGGNSLQALQLLTRIHTTWHTPLTLHQLFLHPTLKELAHHIDTSQREDDAERVLLEAEIGELSEEELDRLLAAEGEMA